MLCWLAPASPVEARAAGADDDSGFLAGWHGTWRGRLENLPARDGAPPIEVVLEIGVGPDVDDGCLDWRSTYFESGEVRQVKDYRFCRAADRYVFDEGAGLELDASIFGDTLYSAFRVNDVQLVTRYRLDGDRLLQEIFFAPASGRKVRAAGEGDIESFAGTGLQRIEFMRSASTHRVLFIGNSYTYYNNLPGILEAIAAGVPSGPAIEAELVGRGGATLGWHLESGPAVEKLRSQRWDFVVLQEQSLWGGQAVDGRARLADPAQFHDAVRRWVALIRQEGAEPVLFMTWARRNPPEEFTLVQQRLAAGYDDIAAELGIPVAPVGLAWAEVHRGGSVPSLYLPDGSHPAAAGSYLAACVVYATITGFSPAGAPSGIRGRPVVVDEEEIAREGEGEAVLVDVDNAAAREVQHAAWRVVSQRVH